MPSPFYTHARARYVARAGIGYGSTHYVGSTMFWTREEIELMHELGLETPSEARRILEEGKGAVETKASTVTTPPLESEPEIPPPPSEPSDGEEEFEPPVSPEPIQEGGGGGVGANGEGVEPSGDQQGVVAGVVLLILLLLILAFGVSRR